MAPYFLSGLLHMMFTFMATSFLPHLDQRPTYPSHVLLLWGTSDNIILLRRVNDLHTKDLSVNSPFLPLTVSTHCSRSVPLKD